LRRFIGIIRQHFRYREYTSLERYRAELTPGTTKRWAVPGERQLEVTPESVADRWVRLRVKVVRAGVSDVNVTTSLQTPGPPAAQDRPAVIGGLRHADGVLLILIWANPDAR
jgi:hypothetical protein